MTTEYPEKEKEKRKFVIEKIKRIVVANERSNRWSFIILLGMLALSLIGIIYYWIQ